AIHTRQPLAPVNRSVTAPLWGRRPEARPRPREGRSALPPTARTRRSRVGRREPPAIRQLRASALRRRTSESVDEYPCFDTPIRPPSAQRHPDYPVNPALWQRGLARQVDELKAGGSTGRLLPVSSYVRIRTLAEDYTVPPARRSNLARPMDF